MNFNMKEMVLPNHLLSYWMDIETNPLDMRVLGHKRFFFAVYHRKVDRKDVKPLFCARPRWRVLPVTYVLREIFSRAQIRDPEYCGLLLLLFIWHAAQCLSLQVRAHDRENEAERAERAEGKRFTNGGYRGMLHLR